MSRIRTTPISVAVHPAGENPTLGDQSTHVLVDDEGGGAFIVLRQCNDYIKPGEVLLDMDELEAVVIAARALIQSHRDVQEESSGT